MEGAIAEDGECSRESEGGEGGATVERASADSGKGRGWEGESSARELHPAKANPPIVVREGGRVSSLRDAQLKKDLLPIVVRARGRTIEEMETQP